MLFKENDNKFIHLGNYEEYFILYMDNELSEVQMKEVDDFVANHPELKSELDLLLSTKLPKLEEIKLDDKEFLLSHVMKAGTTEEELLLLIDNELPEEKQRELLNRISENKTLYNQYELLLKTRLDPSEQIVFPHKELLYKRSEKIISLKVWIRVAAVVLILASLGLIYLSGNNISKVSPTPSLAVKKLPAIDISSPTANQNANQIKNNSNKETVIKLNTSYKKGSNKNIISKNLIITNKDEKQKEIAKNSPNENKEIYDYKKDIASPINESFLSNKTASVDFKAPGINKSPVTSLLSQRTTNNEAVTQPGPIANNNRNGSFKSLLRKAARVIEKKTGIDPANENDQILIGAVAVKIN